jgi:hypothetical protein
VVVLEEGRNTTRGEKDDRRSRRGGRAGEIAKPHVRGFSFFETRPLGIDGENGGRSGKREREGRGLRGDRLMMDKGEIAGGALPPLSR